MNSDQRLRIAHVTATFPPYYGGTGNVCYHNARVLAARGHDVHVYTAAWPGDPDDPPGVTVHRLTTRLRFGNAAVLAALWRELDRFDVVHLHCPFIGSGELAALASKRRRIPLVVTYHNDLIGKGLRGVLFRAYQASLARAILATATRICVVTRGHASASKGVGRLIAKSDSRVLEMPNGVEVERFADRGEGPTLRFRLGLPANAFVVGFVGVLDAAHYFKRLDLLMRAIADERQSDVWLLVIGGGEELSSYKRLAHQFGIADRVCFAGPVAHHDVPAHIMAADAVALPSDAVESFGMVLIEAMACRRPVIATNLPGVRDVVTNGVDGFIVEPGSVAALSTAIRQLAAMTLDERRGMGLAGRCTAETRYDWERIGDRLVTLYRAAVVEQSAGSRPCRTSGTA